MKSLFQVLLYCTMPVCAAFAQGNLFQLEGTLTNMSYVEKVFIKYIDVNNVTIEDSSAVINGKYSFVGSMLEPQDMLLKVRYVPEKKRLQANYYAENNPDKARVYVSPSAIQLNSVDSFAYMKVSGSPWQDDYLFLKGGMDMYSRKFNSLNDQMMAAQGRNDSAAMEKIKANGNIDRSPLVNYVYLMYAKTHPSSPLSLFCLMVCSDASDAVDMGMVQKAFDGLTTEVKDLPSGKVILKRIKSVARTDFGQKAPEFALADTSGKNINLSSFKGKYVLVDFWASWCKPCREEMPYIRKAYEKYKAKGFEVLSITSPKEISQEAWVAAIQKEEMHWCNVWDKTGDVSNTYSVEGIPDNFLVDGNGIIIAKGLRGLALENKLKEIFEK